MRYADFDDNDISYTDSEQLDNDTSNITEEQELSVDTPEQCTQLSIESNSLSTSSSNSVQSIQTQNTAFSNSTSTQTTVLISSVASMVSDTRSTCPILLHQCNSEWTMVQLTKNNNATKLHEAGLIRPIPNKVQKHTLHSSNYNRYDPDGRLSQLSKHSNTLSPTSDGDKPDNTDLLTSNTSSSNIHRECEDQVK
jgi:hypothetical protein